MIFFRSKLFDTNQLRPLFAVVFVGQYVAGLAIQRRTDGGEGGKADRLGLAGLEDREIGQGDVHLLGQLGQGHAPGIEQVVELDDDLHHTVPSSSARISLPRRKICARTKISSAARMPAAEKPS